MPAYKKKNENFFKKWSPEMAYLLGFFAADGCMIRNKREAHLIEFYITDKELLSKIRKLLGSDNKISKRKRNTGWKAGYRLQIGSKIMFEDLLALGMMPRKSSTLKFPKINDEYVHHFVRGYFDGDGNVCVSKYRRANRGNRLNITLLSGFTSGSRIFLENLHVRLKKLAYISGGTLYRSSSAHRLYYSVNDSRKLYKFMYNTNSGLFLIRKKKVFEKYFGNKS